MKKLVIVIFSSLLCFSFVAVSQPINNIHAQKQVPSYAKWGRLAMLKVKEKYPNAEIVDYLHVGIKREINTSTETFKLWLKDPEKEFGVFVEITFNNNTQSIVKINYREVSS